VVSKVKIRCRLQKRQKTKKKNHGKTVIFTQNQFLQNRFHFFGEPYSKVNNHLNSNLMFI